jgi:hypothetical protein
MARIQHDMLQATLLDPHSTFNPCDISLFFQYHDLLPQQTSSHTWLCGREWAGTRTAQFQSRASISFYWGASISHLPLLDMFLTPYIHRKVHTPLIPSKLASVRFKLP